MGSQGGRRRLEPVRRGRRGVRVAGGVLGLLLAAGLTLDVTLGNATSEAPGTSGGSGGAGSTASASAEKTVVPTVVPGLHLERHVPTVAELDKKFAAQGLERVGPAAAQETTFKVSSFNVLGAIHTSTKHSAHPRWPAGASRMSRVVGLLRSYDISVVGFQEFEVPQYHAFLGQTGGAWGVFPGDSLGSQATDDSIAWRRSDWTLVQAGTTPIPYYGPDVAMPHVLLRNTHTGRQVWFANYHNASDDHGPAQGKRDAAVRIEAALVKQLSADGTPVVETGDYNDRQRAACPMMSLGGVHASDGATASGGCSVPMKPYPTVDWVFGTSAVSFSGHVADWSTRDRQISDHEMIRTSASIAPRTDDPACVTRKVRGERLHWCPKT